MRLRTTYFINTEPVFFRMRLVWVGNVRLAFWKWGIDVERRP